MPTLIPEQRQVTLFHILLPLAYPQASYIFESINSTLTVGVDNILDEDPPYFPDSFANDFDPSYRTWGSQFWYVRIASQF